MTALHYSAQGGRHLDVVVALLANPRVLVNQPDNNGMTALHFATCGGYSGVVEALLLAPSIDVNQLDNRGMSALHYVASGGLWGCVRALLADTRVYVNQADNNGMTASVGRGRKFRHESALYQRPEILAPIRRKNTKNIKTKVTRNLRYLLSIDCNSIAFSNALVKSRNVINWPAFPVQVLDGK